jgi:hypothetical protein
LAFNLSADSVSQGVGSATLNGSWSGADIDGCAPAVLVKFVWGYASFSNETGLQSFGGSAGSYSAGIGVDVDRTAKFRAQGSDCSSGIRQSTTLTFKTLANGASLGTPSVFNITQTTAQASCFINPQTLESSGTVTTFIRIAGVGSYVESAGIAVLSGTSGTSVIQTFTGLQAGTTYQIFYRLTRNTVNDTIANSDIVQFVTAGGDPTVFSF